MSPPAESAQPAKKPWVSDALASSVVFLVALPLCIGIAVACGVPAERGLITGIIGGIVVGWLAGSPLLVSGPAASLIVPVFDLVQTHGLVALAPVVMLAGLWQAIAGLLRLGQWFRAVAPAVINGMLIGIGFLIFASQLHVAIDADPESSFIANISTFPGALQRQLVADPTPVVLSVATIAILVVWTKFRPRFLSLVPGHLVALLTVTIVTLVSRPQVEFLDIAPSFFDGLAPVSIEDLRILTDSSILGLSLMFAFVASAATLLTANAIDQRQTFSETNYDREMFAQGVGNMLTGSLGGLPMTGVIVRSSVNVDAGARTRLSTIFHGIWILLFVSVAPEALESIPKACLGAILVYTGYRLIDVKALVGLYRHLRGELAIALLTLFGVVFIELFVGIVLGLGAAFVKLIYTFSRLEVRSEPDPDGHLHHFRLTGSATFIQLPRLAKALDRVPMDRELHVHIDRLDHIDHACLELLSSWKRRRESRGAPSMVVEWDELTDRYRNALVGTGVGDNSQSASLLRIVWGEWKRLYSGRMTPQPANERGWRGWIDASRICVEPDVSSIQGVIAVAAELLAPPAERSSDELSRALTDRIEGHVVLGDGVSIPHAPIEGLERPLAALVISRNPIDVAGERADLFFVLLAPARLPNEHLRALAHVGRLCHDTVLLTNLRNASSSNDAAALIRTAEESTGELQAATTPDQALLAIIEIHDPPSVERLRVIIEEALGTPRIVSRTREPGTLEALDGVVDGPLEGALLLLPIAKRDEPVLRALLDEHARSFASSSSRFHLLRAESPSETFNDSHP